MSRELPHCRHCQKPFTEVARSKHSPNVCQECRAEQCRIQRRAYYAAHKGKPGCMGRPANGNGLLAYAPGVETWPEPADVVDAEKRARAVLYHGDLVAGRPIGFVPVGLRLTGGQDGQRKKEVTCD